MSEQPNEQASQQRAAESQSTDSPEPTPRHAEAFLHELQEYQIKLESQNEQFRRAQIELEKSLERYVDFYDFSPVGYLTLNHEGLIEEVNLTGTALLRIERDKLLHHRFAPFVASADRDRWHNHFFSVLKQDNKLSCELMFQHGDGSCFHAQLNCLCIRKEGKETEVRVVLTDITERKRVEEALREQEEFFRMITENVEDFIAVLDLEGRRLYNSPSYTKFFGDPEALKNTDSFADIHPNDQERIKQLFKETVQTGIGHRAEYRFVLPNGSIRHMESCGGLIKSSQGKALRMVVVSHDITARKQAEDEIHKLAFYDVLTKLPNRRLLNDRLAQTMAASKRSAFYCALIFIDMDNFKPLNDGYGHDVGDLLLVEVACRINSCVREMDTVARFGGDEFVVVLSKLAVNKVESAVQAGIVAEKIRTSLAEPYALKIQYQGKVETMLEHHCTASIGVVLFTNHEASVEGIIKWADMAMYQAKEAGRNQIQFFDAKE